MIDRKSYVTQLVSLNPPATEFAKAFAPSNIALCKYWGKKNLDLNIASTPSLSISLGDRGTKVQISINSLNSLSINGKNITEESPAFKRTFDFLELFIAKNIKLTVKSENNIPTAAGLASSASFFAALTIALDKLCNWQAPRQTLSCFGHFIFWRISGLEWKEPAPAGRSGGHGPASGCRPDPRRSHPSSGCCPPRRPT